jgi:phosphoglycolate phosphatase-like HAD superfamily hydrolase
LYGPSTQAAALDVESKFTEAALGSVQTADYRNFAHGRHLWLAKRGETTGILALVTDEDRELADKTLRLIPTSVPVAKIDVPHRGNRAGLAAIASVLHIVGEAGRARGIDPGRPGVPAFGSKIYKLRAFGTQALTGHSTAPPEAIAIERKTGSRVAELAARGELDFWEKSYRSFIERLGAASYKAVVFDYDGTLCDGRDRYVGMGDEVADHLLRLLKAGVFVGIATGRGKSVKDDFRRRLPATLWGRVLVGYYNCADNGLLDDNSHPDSTSSTCDDLAPVARLLQESGALARLASCTYRRMQITVEPTGLAPTPFVWGIVQQLALEADVRGVTVVRSSHSVDVLAPHVTKQAIVRRVVETLGLGESAPVLCVGDRGQWPGNDFALLNEPHSLSVDEVSADPGTCWNLAPPGHRGVQATLDYLKALKFKDSSAVIAFPTAGRRL